MYGSLKKEALHMQIAPSVLAADFTRLGEQVQRVAQGGADYIHLDIMDGHFVPNISFGPAVVAALRPLTGVPFDVHLMLRHPLQYVPDFLKAGADVITFHVECGDPIEDTIAAIHNGGAKAGLVIKPGTPAEALWPWLDHIDMVLVMTVEPGFGGQAFMADMMDKVRAIRKKAPQMLIEADGGINAQTIRQCAQAGVDLCVAGTSVFRAEDVAEAIAGLKREADSGSI
jgi:ribulose-phosphate 3-epimerase